MASSHFKLSFALRRSSFQQRTWQRFKFGLGRVPKDCVPFGRRYRPSKCIHASGQQSECFQSSFAHVQPNIYSDRLVIYLIFKINLFECALIFINQGGDTSQAQIRRPSTPQRSSPPQPVSAPEENANTTTATDKKEKNSKETAIWYEYGCV